MRHEICLTILALAAATAVGREPHEPLTDYYGAKGRGIGARWDIPQTAVTEERDLAATLVITGATNPTEVRKPDLKKLPAFNDFVVTDAADPPRTTSDKEIRFNYTLRPRHRGVAQVPQLKFHYYNPTAAESKRFPYTLAYAVPITVAPPPPKEPEPMTEPDDLFHVRGGPAALDGPFEPCRWAWGAAALFGPLVAAGWFLLWRRVYPDARRLAQLRRSRAARRAVSAVRKSGRAPDPPAAVAAALLGYLRARYPLPESAVTPSEVAAALVEAKVPADAAERTAGVFRGCDRARFAPPGDGGVALAAEAEAAIARLEELA
jgi:hypothetical protein